MRPTILRAGLLGLLIALLALPIGDLRAGVTASSRQPAGSQEQTEKQQQPPQYAISVEVPAVNVDVVVTDNKGNFITGLKKENFRIFDDGVPQSIANFAPTDAPITIVMLMEFSRIAWGYFAYKATLWAPDFLHYLNQKDWVALVIYDLKPHIEVDFTQNKSEVQQAINNLFVPGFSEANMVDALIDTLDRLQDVKGKKSILLIASGLDTFSKHTLDDALKRVKQTDITIFCVGVGRTGIEMADARNALSDTARLTFLQAQNEMSTFAKLTGGIAWFPRFDGELPDIFRNVAAALRSQYTLAYTPADVKRDGKFHKIKVDLVGPDGQPLIVLDQHQKKVKYVVYAREGYILPKATTGD